MDTVDPAWSLYLQKKLSVLGLDYIPVHTTFNHFVNFCAVIVQSARRQHFLHAPQYSLPCICALSRQNMLRSKCNAHPIFVTVNNVQHRFWKAILYLHERMEEYLPLKYCRLNQNPDQTEKILAILMLRAFWRYLSALTWPILSIVLTGTRRSTWCTPSCSKPYSPNW